MRLVHAQAAAGFEAGGRREFHHEIGHVFARHDAGWVLERLAFARRAAVDFVAIVQPRRPQDRVTKPGFLHRGARPGEKSYPADARSGALPHLLPQAQAGLPRVMIPAASTGSLEGPAPSGPRRTVHHRSSNRTTRRSSLHKIQAEASFGEADPTGLNTATSGRGAAVQTTGRSRRKTRSDIRVPRV